MTLFYARSSKIARMAPFQNASLLFLICLSLSSCAPVKVAGLPAIGTEALNPAFPTLAASQVPTQTPTTRTTPSETRTALPSLTATLTPLPAGLALDPLDWHNWPILPIVPEKARLIYQLGQSLGNDPHAFSIFGDCQSIPPVFLGLYETDQALAAGLPADLQETVAWFAGSFARQSPTLRGGTTSAALLSPAWHQNLFTCTSFETPLLCEIRIHRPSFVILHVGTHFTERNDRYMRTILDQVTALGVVPILATKADNSEADEEINQEYAELAVEYGIPVWNFWAAVVSLPNRGLYTRTSVPAQGDLYLTRQAQVIHRLTALQALDVVWRVVTAP